MRPIHEHLDTAYVNLAALLRYLRARDFVGRVRIEMQEYEAEVFLDGGGTIPRVREINRASGREAEGDAAYQRLMVRAQEPGGRINVYENTNEEDAAGEERAGFSTSETSNTPQALEEDGESVEPTEIAWPDLLRLSGDLIAGVERAAKSFGADFTAMFRAARIELADDFSFLDPAAQQLEYAQGTVRMNVQPGVNTYISSISECLRRVVDKLAAPARSRSVRERVALELAVVARRREGMIRQLKLAPYLERIAGTKVL
ncbi:MAG TPA: hypothetical protein VM911_14015 [Pyrinomonadaceae bacterium]|nr:hypothetical protein [Pyrinomonadaceae bacterium]